MLFKNNRQSQISNGWAKGYFGGKSRVLDFSDNVSENLGYNSK